MEVSQDDYGEKMTLRTARLKTLLRAAIHRQNLLKNHDKEWTLWAVLDFMNGDEQPLALLGEAGSEDTIFITQDHDRQVMVKK
jgi:hypothetical protein